MQRFEHDSRQGRLLRIATAVTLLAAVLCFIDFLLGTSILFLVFALIFVLIAAETLYLVRRRPSR
jgi:hypothetical protein